MLLLVVLYENMVLVCTVSMIAHPYGENVKNSRNYCEDWREENRLARGSWSVASVVPKAEDGQGAPTGAVLATLRRVDQTSAYGR